MPHPKPPITVQHLQLGGVHEHRPDGDMAVRAYPDHLHNVQSQDKYLRVNLPTHLGADGLEVRELLTEVPPLASLQLRQSVRICVMLVFKILTHLLSMKIRMVNLPTNF